MYSVEVCWHIGKEPSGVGVLVTLHDPYSNSRKFFIEDPAGNALLAHVMQAALGAVEEDFKRYFKLDPQPKLE
jgi:hypothetical protein